MTFEVTGTKPPWLDMLKSHFDTRRHSSQFSPGVPTSSVASATHSVIGSPSAHHVVAATTRGPVVGARSLHAHGLPLGFVMGPHLSAATLEDLNVPKSIEMPQ